MRFEYQTQKWRKKLLEGWLSRPAAVEIKKREKKLPRRGACKEFELGYN
mgnify:CR=1 FL=1